MLGVCAVPFYFYWRTHVATQAPDVFRCAVAGAPVTSWDGYDTHYTERYMGGTPAQLPEAYAGEYALSRGP